MHENVYLTPAQYVTVHRNVVLANRLFTRPIFLRISDTTWEWLAFYHVASGTDMRVDTLNGQVHCFRYGSVSATTGKPSVVLTLDEFTPQAVAMLQWQPRPKDPPPAAEQATLPL